MDKARVISVINLKGGVGKSAAVVGLAETYAAKGKRVLCIDADHQGTSSALLAGVERLDETESKRRTLYHWLSQMLFDDFSPKKIKKYIQSETSGVTDIKTLDLITASHQLDRMASKFSDARSGQLTPEHFLRAWKFYRRPVRKWLDEHYDYVIIDSPPNLAAHVRYLLMLSDGYLVPSIPDPLSMRGITTLTERLESHKIKTPALGVLWTMVRAHTSRHADIIGERNPEGIPKPFRTYIPNATYLVNALDPELEYATMKVKYTQEGVDMYKAIARTIDRRLKDLDA